MTNPATDYSKKDTAVRGFTSTGVGGAASLVSYWLTERYKLDPGMAVLVSGIVVTFATSAWRMLCHWYALSQGTLAARLRTFFGGPLP